MMRSPILDMGLRWKSFTTPGSIDDDLSMAHVFGMLALDAVICLFITWYVEAVKPGEEGVPEKPWFLFTVHYIGIRGC